MAHNFYATDEGTEWNISRDTTFRLSFALWNMSLSRLNQNLNAWRDYADILYDDLEPLFLAIPEKYHKEKWPEKLKEIQKRIDHVQVLYNSLQADDNFDPKTTSEFIGLLREYSSIMRTIMYVLNIYLYQKESVLSKIQKQFDVKLE